MLLLVFSLPLFLLLLVVVSLLLVVSFPPQSFFSLLVVVSLLLVFSLLLSSSFLPPLSFFSPPHASFLPQFSSSPPLSFSLPQFSSFPPPLSFSPPLLSSSSNSVSPTSESAAAARSSSSPHFPPPSSHDLRTRESRSTTTPFPRDAEERAARACRSQASPTEKESGVAVASLLAMRAWRVVRVYHSQASQRVTKLEVAAASPLARKYAALSAVSRSQSWGWEAEQASCFAVRRMTRLKHPSVLTDWIDFGTLNLLSSSPLHSQRESRMKTQQYKNARGCTDDICFRFRHRRGVIP